MNWKSATVVLAASILVAVEITSKHGDSFVPSKRAAVGEIAPKYSDSLVPSDHVHSEMRTEHIATTASYLSASGARVFRPKSYTWEIIQAGPHSYDTYRDGQFMGTRSKRQLWMDAHFHSRYESLMCQLDQTHKAKFQIVKGALSQFNPFPAYEFSARIWRDLSPFLALRANAPRLPISSHTSNA
jgi:hypothetical protein